MRPPGGGPEPDAAGEAAGGDEEMTARVTYTVTYTSWIPWFFSGTERMRLPVAWKNAFSTAGAATQIVGSPMPPQMAPPVGMMIDSTFGICAMRIES